jgi:hypothetical protein
MRGEAGLLNRFSAQLVSDISVQEMAKQLIAEVDAITGEFVGTPNPILFIRLDGGDEWTIFGHIAEEMDAGKYPRGARVQAVWKPQPERQGKTSDIKFFRLIKE